MCTCRIYPRYQKVKNQTYNCLKNLLNSSVHKHYNSIYEENALLLPLDAGGSKANCLVLLSNKMPW